MHGGTCLDYKIQEAEAEWWGSGQPGLLSKFQASLDCKVRLKKQNKHKHRKLKVISFAFLESQEIKINAVCAGAEHEVREEARPPQTA